MTQETAMLWSAAIGAISGIGGQWFMSWKNHERELEKIAYEYKIQALHKLSTGFKKWAAFEESDKPECLLEYTEKYKTPDELPHNIEINNIINETAIFLSEKLQSQIRKIYKYHNYDDLKKFDEMIRNELKYK